MLSSWAKLPAFFPPPTLPWFIYIFDRRWHMPGVAPETVNLATIKDTVYRGKLNGRTSTESHSIELISTCWTASCSFSSDRIETVMRTTQIRQHSQLFTIQMAYKVGHTEVLPLISHVVALRPQQSGPRHAPMLNSQLAPHLKLTVISLASM